MFLRLQFRRRYFFHLFGTILSETSKPSWMDVLLHRSGNKHVKHFGSNQLCNCALVFLGPNVFKGYFMKISWKRWAWKKWLLHKGFYPPQCTIVLLIVESPPQKLEVPVDYSKIWCDQTKRRPLEEKNFASKTWRGTCPNPTSPQFRRP